MAGKEKKRLLRLGDEVDPSEFARPQLRLGDEVDPSEFARPPPQYMQGGAASAPLPPGPADLKALFLDQLLANRGRR